jgi:predicted O-methyltransferase YrrM
MIFSTAQASSVFADYEARRAAESQRMALPAGQGAVAIDELLLPIGPEAGAVLHSLILAHRPKRILELGTSYGYSTLFLADAAHSVGATVITMELADYKQAYARAKIAEAGLAGAVDFRLGDAVALIRSDPGPFDFVLLDIWKNLYVPCLEAFYPKLADEAIVAADNMVEPVSARDEVRLYRAAVRSKADLQTTLLPIGQGIELSVKWVAGSNKL